MVDVIYFCCKCENEIIVAEEVAEGIFFEPYELVCIDCPINCIECGQELTVWEDQYCLSCENQRYPE